VKKWRQQLAIYLLGYDPHDVYDALTAERDAYAKRLSENAEIVKAAKEVLRRVHSTNEIENCLSKMQYTTRAEAEQAKLTLWYKDKRILDVYSCKVCRLFHLTTGKAPAAPVNTSERMKTSIGDLIRATKEKV
jgi:hypothetical protein